jgi:hypothetical protein
LDGYTPSVFGREGSNRVQVNHKINIYYIVYNNIVPISPNIYTKALSKYILTLTLIGLAFINIERLPY